MTLRTLLYLAVVFFTFVMFPSAIGANTQKSPLVDIGEIDNSMFVDMRYFGTWNFLGRNLKSYKSNKCLLSSPAAKALKSVQSDVQKQGLSLLVLDCYRPQSAVNEFVAWARDDDDQKMKKIFFPMETKSKLFERGFIASQSGHSRGSTIDLTLIDLKKVKMEKAVDEFREPEIDCREGLPKDSNNPQLDMGSFYDCFSEVSHMGFKKISLTAQKNRILLKSLMEKHGFKSYAKEWWHYTLKKEPYPNSYFDFPVE